MDLKQSRFSLALIAASNIQIVGEPLHTDISYTPNPEPVFADMPGLW